ncbi:hypothetical protein SAMN02745121_08446 [Nannocystis exedens]|uniref:Uncharacterized protein n=2 Tax=Nannocystis exedens TaxID=54 RepID=A0A1I2I522_9BACT|nr:hypothetical protein SAMN02745121_08446 [Nannocystis exedens]
MTWGAAVLAFAARGTVGEAAESDDWLIDQAVAEYEAYCAGELRPSVKVREFPDGELQFCGRLEDRSRWTIAYVHAADRAVTPLAVGDFEHVFAAFTRLDRAEARFEDPRLFPPPSVRVGGARHRFQAVQGCLLVGVARLDRAAVLLCALGDRIAVVYLEGRSRVVLDVKPPLGLREVDVDRMLGFHRPRGACANERRGVGGVAREPPPEIGVAPTPAVQAHHIRIVRGLPVEVGSGPSISEVLRGCFEDIERRVRAQKKPGKKLRGRTKLCKVLGVLLRLALLGCGDLVGLTGEIIAEIRMHVPEFEITAEAFADVLNLMRAAKTCLVERHARERIWRINLVKLADPRSALHLQLCKETTGGVRVHEVAANHRPASGESGPIGGLGSRERAKVERHATVSLRASDSQETTSAQATGHAASMSQIAAVGFDIHAARGAGAGSSGLKDSQPHAAVTVARHLIADWHVNAKIAGILNQLADASPMVLIAAMLAVAQVRQEAEEAWSVERAAWEAERRALTVQLEAAAKRLARGEKAEIGVRCESASACSHGDGGNVVADPRANAVLPNHPFAIDELSLRRTSAAGAATTSSSKEVVGLEQIVADDEAGHESPGKRTVAEDQAWTPREERPSDDHSLRKPTLDDSAAEDPPSTAAARRWLRLSHAAAGARTGSSDFMSDYTGPASPSCLASAGSLGPRGPPTRGWRRPAVRGRQR